MFKRFLKSERGIGLIENLVSISIISLVVASAASSMFMSFYGNAAARTYTAIVSDVQGLIDGLRNSPYPNVLDKFGTTYTAIAHNQTATEVIASSEANANYTVTYTAIKRSALSIPDAIKVSIGINHKVGSLGANTYSFETIVAQHG